MQLRLYILTLAIFQWSVASGPDKRDYSIPSHSDSSLIMRETKIYGVMNLHRGLYEAQIIDAPQVGSRRVPVR